VELIIKKEIMENWINITKVYHFKRKGIKYLLMKYYYKIKTFEYEGEERHYTVEEVEDKE
jgi:hypothetical protein